MTASANSHEDKQQKPRFFGSVRATQITLRIGYIGCSAYLFWAGLIGFNSQDLKTNPQLLFLIFGLYILAFCLMYLGAADLSYERLVKWQTLIFVSFLLAFLFQYFMRLYEVQFIQQPTDTFLFSDYSSQLLLLGENPYSTGLEGAYSDFRVSKFFSTPLLNGELVSGLNYPALHLLTFLPSAALGILDARIIPVIAFIGTMLLFYGNAPAPLKGIVLLPLFVNWDYVNWPVGFVTDGVWAFLLIAMVASWRRPYRRAILFGLAAAHKQVPWLLGPFIVLRLWMDKDDPDPSPPMRRVARFVGVSIATFIIINAPFMLDDMASWVSGVFFPLAEPLILYGQGVSAATQFGLLQLPKSFYLLATVITFVALGLVYWLNFRFLKEAMWIFPGMFLWFSYRSLQSYYIYWLLILMMALLIKYRESESLASEAEPIQKIHPYSWIILGIAGASLVGFVAYFQFTMAVPEIKLADAPTGASPHEISHLSLRITNTADKEISPRIGIHSEGHQPFPWLIESGPRSLAPGQEGLYNISTDLPFRMIDLVRGALVVVTDASGDYQVRSTLEIPRDTSLIPPDNVFNASYLHSPGEDEIPWGWQFESVGQHPAGVGDVESSEGFRAIELVFTPTLESDTWEYAALSQWILLPTEEMVFWVHPPPLESNPSPELAHAYGLEFDDGLRKLWILFGPKAGSGYLAEDHYYQYQFALSGEWSHQQINLRSIYDQLDWKLPPLQRVLRGDLELLTRMVTVKLIVAARDQQKADEISAIFGPLHIVEDRMTASERVADAVSFKAEYSAAIGDLKLEQRNYADASTDYSAALSADPDLPVAYLGLGESLFWQANYEDAALAYRQVLGYPDLQAQAYKGLAWTKYNLGEYNLAKIYFNESIRLGIEPALSLADSYNGLGWVYIQVGECEEATSYFDQAVEINPEFSDALRGIETCRDLKQLN